MMAADRNPGERTALRVGGEEISLHDLLSGARFRGQLDFIDDAVDAALIRAAAVGLGTAVSDEELQKEADDFRSARQLYSAASTHAWLAARHLAQEDWEYLLEDGILRRKVRAAVCAGKVEQYFAENRRSFDAATIVEIVVAEESVARELRAQCVEDQVPFAEIARRFPEARFVGTLPRNGMEPMMAAAVFAAEPGAVAGPVRSERGWRLALVECLHPARLDEATRERIAGLLFEQWLRQQRQKAPIEAPIVELW